MPKCRCIIGGEFKTVELLKENDLTVLVEVPFKKIKRHGRGIGERAIDMPGLGFIGVPGHRGYWRETVTGTKVIKRHKEKHCVTILP